MSSTFAQIHPSLSVFSSIATFPYSDAIFAAIKIEWEAIVDVISLCRLYDGMLVVGVRSVFGCRKVVIQNT